MAAKDKRRGLTLIEVIISLAIICIVAVAFSSIFLSGLKGIEISGNKSKAKFKTQAQIEEIINSKVDAFDPDLTTLNVDFGTKVISIDGKYITKESEINKNKVKITVFTPVN